MKGSGRVQTQAALLLVVSFVFLSGCNRRVAVTPTQPTASAPSATSPASTSSVTNIDQRLNQLAQQLRLQQEQTREILEALKDKQVSGSPNPPPAVASASTANSNTLVHTSTSIDADDTTLVHGWVARIMPVGSDASVVPSDELAHFDALKDSYRIGDFAKESSMRIGVDVGWKGEGYLEARQPGHYTFSINFIRDKVIFDWGNHTNAYYVPCWGSILVEGHPVAQGQHVTVAPRDNNSTQIQSVVGGADLEVVGRYRVQFWVACGDLDNNIVTTTDNNERLQQVLNVLFEVMIKRPSDSAPISAAKALVIKVPKQ